MMFSQKVFKKINTVALFAIVFASLAPSVSHALAAKQGVNSFIQEVCSANGESITIQVVTSQGQLLATELDTAQTTSSNAKSIISHLNHCPFCNNPSVNSALEPSNAWIVLSLQNQVTQLAVNLYTSFTSFTTLPPPAQAPPSFS